MGFETNKPTDIGKLTSADLRERIEVLVKEILSSEGGLGDISEGQMHFGAFLRTDPSTRDRVAAPHEEERIMLMAAVEAFRLAASTEGFDRELLRRDPAEAMGRSGVQKFNCFMNPDESLALLASSALGAATALFFKKRAEEKKLGEAFDLSWLEEGGDTDEDAA